MTATLFVPFALCSPRVLMYFSYETTSFFVLDSNRTKGYKDIGNRLSVIGAMQGATFRQLEIFVEIVEMGSFRACGDRLGISQPSISNHIKSLERKIGGVLFVRQRGGAGSLTEHGFRIYNEAKDLLDRAERLGLEPRSRPARTRRNVVIGAHSSVARLLSAALPRFAADHAELNFVLENLQYEQLLEKVSSGQVDIGYFYYFGEPTEIKSKIVGQREFGIYVSPKHRLAGQELIEIEQFRSEPAIMLPQGTNLRIAIEKALTASSLVGWASVMETEQFEIVKEATMLGLGFSCLFKQSVAGEVARGLLCELTPNCPPLMLDLRQTIAPRFRRDAAINGISDNLNQMAFH